MQRITSVGYSCNSIAFVLKATRIRHRECWSFIHNNVKSQFPVVNKSTERHTFFCVTQRISKIHPQNIPRCFEKQLFSKKVKYTSHGPTRIYFSSVSKQNEDDESAKPTRKVTIPQKFVAAFPVSLQPYLRLSRIQNPIGTWLLFLPCTWGLALGAGGPPPLCLLALFGTGAFIMRGAGCTINDMWDKQIDAKVKRTSDRPLASGVLRTRHATAWLFVQLSLAFSILLQLNAPCFFIGVASLGLVCVYPLAKRVTNWPQAVLGLTFNTGVLMGFTAIQKGQLEYLTFPWIDPSCLSLYLAGISWTLIYDTIYAHQDLEDDAVLGLGSTARKFGDDTKIWLSGFSFIMISSLTAVGVLGDLSWPYYAGIAATASHLAWQIKTLDIKNAQNCSDRFNSNRNIGWIVLMSIIGASLYDKRKVSQNPIDPISISEHKHKLAIYDQKDIKFLTLEFNVTSPSRE